MPIFNTVWYAYKFVWAQLKQRQLWPVLWLPMMVLVALFSAFSGDKQLLWLSGEFAASDMMFNLVYLAVFEVWIAFHLYRLCLGIGAGHLAERSDRFGLFIRQSVLFFAIVFMLPIIGGIILAFLLPAVEPQALVGAVMILVAVHYSHFYPMLPAAAMGLKLTYSQAVEASTGTRLKLFTMILLAMIGFIILSSVVYALLAGLPYGDYIVGALLQPMLMMSTVFIISALFKNRYHQASALVDSDES